MLRKAWNNVDYSEEQCLGAHVFAAVFLFHNFLYIPPTSCHSKFTLVTENFEIINSHSCCNSNDRLLAHWRYDSSRWELETKIVFNNSIKTWCKLDVLVIILNGIIEKTKEKSILKLKFIHQWVDYQLNCLQIRWKVIPIIPKTVLKESIMNRESRITQESVEILKMVAKRSGIKMIPKNLWEARENRSVPGQRCQWKTIKRVHSVETGGLSIDQVRMWRQM